MFQVNHTGFYLENHSSPLIRSRQAGATRLGETLSHQPCKKAGIHANRTNGVHNPHPMHLHGLLAEIRAALGAYKARTYWFRTPMCASTMQSRLLRLRDSPGLQDPHHSRFDFSVEGAKWVMAQHMSAKHASYAREIATLLDVCSRWQIRTALKRREQD